MTVVLMSSLLRDAFLDVKLVVMPDVQILMIIDGKDIDAQIDV